MKKNRNDSEMIKVLQLGKFFPVKGGVEKVMFDLSSSLVENGISTEVLCASKDRINRYFLYDNVPVHATSTWFRLFSTMISPSMVLKIRKISSKFDLIHIHHPDPMAAISLFLSGYKGKVVLHWHSDILRQKELLIFFSPLQKWLLDRSDIIIATSPIYAEHSTLLNHYKNKLRVVPIGIKQSNLIKNTEQIKLKYLNKKIIFSLGRLIYYKGFEYLIQAAHYLSNDYVIVIGGSGPLETKLKDQIQNQSLNEKVFLIGQISDEEVDQYFSACNVFCLSSIEKTEAFGIVILEAMAHSKPVVATNIEGSGVPWVNQHGVSGLNVPPRDPKMIAEAITDICDDQNLYNKLSEGAIGRYEQLFTIKQMGTSILNIYHELICRK